METTVPGEMTEVPKWFAGVVIAFLVFGLLYGLLSFMTAEQERARRVVKALRSYDAQSAKPVTSIKVDHNQAIITFKEKKTVYPVSIPLDRLEIKTVEEPPTVRFELRFPVNIKPEKLESLTRQQAISRYLHLATVQMSRRQVPKVLEPCISPP